MAMTVPFHSHECLHGLSDESDLATTADFQNCKRVDGAGTFEPEHGLIVFLVIPAYKV